MKYYIIYKEYTEYNQFEGSWDTVVEEFPTLEECQKSVYDMEKNNNIKEIVGPLKKA